MQNTRVTRINRDEVNFKCKINRDLLNSNSARRLSIPNKNVLSPGTGSVSAAAAATPKTKRYVDDIERKSYETKKEIEELKAELEMLIKDNVGGAMQGVQECDNESIMTQQLTQRTDQSNFSTPGDNEIADCETKQVPIKPSPAKISVRKKNLGTPHTGKNCSIFRNIYRLDLFVHWLD